MSNVIAIVQARMGSTRLPGKVLADLGGQTVLAHVLRRAAAVASVAEVVVATSDRPQDDPVLELARHLGFRVHRGSENDVLDRYVGAARGTSARWVVRVTGDNPFVDPRLLEALLALAEATAADYSAPRGFPIGTFGEVISHAALEASGREARDPADREHVTMFAKRNPERFKLAWLEAPLHVRREYRLTVDEPADLSLAREVVARLPAEAGLPELIALLDADPSLASRNAHVRQAVPFEPAPAV